MIVFIQPHFEYPGGAGRVVLEFAEGLSEQGYEVAVVARGPYHWAQAEYPGVTFVWLGIPISSAFAFWLLWPIWYWKVARAVKKLRPAILLPHVFPANLWASAYRLRHPDVPSVWYCHEPSAFIHDVKAIRAIRGIKRPIAFILRPLLGPIDVWLAHAHDEILTNSEFTRGRVKSVYGRDATVVSPGVSDRFVQARRADRTHFLVVGRLTRFKNVDLVLKAFAHLASTYGEAPSLHVVGDGEQQDDLIRQAHELGLGEAVSFLGRVSNEDLAREYGTAKALIVAATDEPFGLVVLEAIAAGAYVIASRSGGPTETVVEPETGTFFEPNDATSLAERIREVEQGKQYERMREEGGAEIAGQFSWRSGVEKLLSVVSKYGC